MKLTGFRDPYIIQQGHGQQKWKMLLGSGIEGQGGTLLVYETTHLSSGHCLSPQTLRITYQCVPAFCFAWRLLRA